MKAYEKRKLYRRRIKELVRSGKVNTAEGQWTEAKSDITAHAHMLAGHQYDRPTKHPHGRVQWTKKGNG